MGSILADPRCLIGDFMTCFAQVLSLSAITAYITPQSAPDEIRIRAQSSSRGIRAARPSCIVILHRIALSSATNRA